MPEVAGGAAVLVDPYSPKEMAGKMADLLSDEQNLKTLREKGLQRSALFTWEAAAEQLLSVYEKISILCA